MTKGEATAARIADGAIRVIGRDGFDMVSVRTVATEVGLAPGTVQHHFPTRDQLLVGAYRRVTERTLQRVQVDSPQGSYAAALRQGLMQTFPFDERRREEQTVWLALSAAAPTRSALAEAHREGVAEFRSILRGVLLAAASDGQLRPEVDPDIESARIPAIFDGMALHAVSARPQDVEVLAAMLVEVIDALFIEPAGAGPDRA